MSFTGLMVFNWSVSRSPVDFQNPHDYRTIFYCVSSMISLIQRVSSARVLVHEDTIGQIDKGLLVLICAERGDNESVSEKMLDKIIKLRIFNDDQGKMNRSILDEDAGLLIVSQFTLAADCSGGNRPSFSTAAAPEEGHELYDHFVASARRRLRHVESGQFGANMQVHLVNDGPVTIPLRIQPQIHA